MIRIVLGGLGLVALEGSVVLARSDVALDAGDEQKTTYLTEEEMARKLRESLAATLLLAFLAVSTAGAQPPTTTTNQVSGFETFSSFGCRGEIVDITQEWTAVVHTTLFDDGRLHVAGTMAIDNSWTQGGAIYSGHATSSFHQNSNNRAFNGSIMLNGQGDGSDGAKFSIRIFIHTTINANGEVAVDFERFSVECR